MTVERKTCAPATVKPLHRSKEPFFGSYIFLGGSYLLRQNTPVCPAWGEGQLVQRPVGAVFFVSAVHETQFHLYNVVNLDSR